MNLPTQCRMCLTECAVDKLESMLTIWKDSITLWTMYLYIMNVSEKINSASAPFICIKCKEDLKLAYLFKVMCMETEKTLSELVTSYQINNESKIEYVVYDCKDNIVQYTKEYIANNIDEDIGGDKDVFEDIGEDVAEAEDVFNDDEEECEDNSTESVVGIIGDECEGTDGDYPDEVDLQETEGEPPTSKVVSRKCKKCNIKFENITEYRVHYRQLHQRAYDRKHHKSNARKCPSCNIDFENVKLYQVHYRRYHKRPVERADKDSIQPKVVCSHCGQLFAKSFIAKHLKNKHSGEQKSHECTTCGKCFSLIENLIMHKRIHTNDKRFECEVCGEKFLYWATRRNHIRSKHTGEMNYQCHICEKKFTHSSTMYQHIRRHRNELPHSCDTCSKGFLTTVELKNHQIVHTKVKNEICDKCNKRFGTRKNLLAHMKVHSERNNVCTVCDKRFTRPQALRTHMKLHPGVEMPE